MFDYRLSYVENSIKHIVTQTDYREDLLAIETKLQSKFDKALELVQRDIDLQKDAISIKSAEFQEVVNQNEMKTLLKIKDCEEMLKHRISENYLEKQLKSRDEKLHKSIEKSSDKNLLRLDYVYKDLMAKHKYLDNLIAENNKQTLDRETYFAFKVDVDNVNHNHLALKAKVNEFNVQFEDALTDFKKNVMDFNKRVTEMHKTITTITKEHEDLTNAAHIAASAQDLLNECTIKLDTTDKEIKRINRTLENKTDNDEFFKQIQRKMDRQEVMNLIGSDEEKRRIKECVIKETSHIDRSIRNMEKYWDAKLVKIRNELNIHQLTKRIDEKASDNEIKIMFEESNMRMND